MEDFGFLGGVAAAISNYFSNRETNATNLQIQQETNAANRELAERQNQWNLEMWNRQNAYNDPSAQMSRLRAAGINPALAVTNGSMMNEAAPAPEAAGSRDQAAKMQSYYLDPLTMAQIGLIQAQTRKTDSETTYQNYINAVEEALAHSPLSQVTIRDNEGNESVEITYGNARVEFAKRELEAIGLENLTSNADLNALLFDIAILTGSDAYGLAPAGLEAASDQSGYASARAALVGDQNVKTVAGQIADLSLEAAKAEKAGRQAYAAFLDKHKDEPIWQFILGLQGFVQTLGIRLPAFGGSSSESGTRYIHRTSRSWFFGGRR